MSGYFYRRLGTDGGRQLFESTDYTRSNWDPAIQHGSPPLALLTAAVQELAAAADLRIARLALDILGTIPVTRVAVHAWTARPGRRISLLAAEMRAVGDERPVARLSAWALATGDTSDVAADRYPPLVEGDAVPLPAMFAGKAGYFEAIDWRPQRTVGEDAAVWWVRPLVRVVDGDPDTPLLKLAGVIDSCNGVGAVLHPDRFWFMNTDTAVHLHRLPTGADFALRARASIGPDGVGVTTAEIFDRAGFVGTSAQTLLVQRRP